MKAHLVGSFVRAAGMAAIPLTVLSVPAIASPTTSGQRELLEWRGRVDQEIRLQIQGGRASVLTVGPREPVGYNSAHMVSGIPSTNGYVSVQMRQGRGNVDVIQQPDARNGYTTVIRIRDQQSGAGTYDIAAFWQRAGNSSSYGNYSYGNTGRYQTYPAPAPVQRGVYDTRGTVGKTLPVPARPNVNASRNQYPQYPGNRVGNARPRGSNAQPGKALPDAKQATKSGKTLPDKAQNGQQHRYYPPGR